MSVLDRIAYFQNRRDEIPNQELARQLAQAKDMDGIQEIHTALTDKNQNVQSDCLKVLYEIGYLDPQLIAPYWEDFLVLLKSRNNRMVWGSMIALSTIAGIKAKEVGAHVADIQKTMEAGSVISVDNGVKILAEVAAADPDLSKTIFPYLLEHLHTCRLKEVPQHAEKTLVAVDAANKADFIATLQHRLDSMTPSQSSRVKKVIRAAEKR